jgi:hypothetical protein
MPSKPKTTTTGPVPTAKQEEVSVRLLAEGDDHPERNIEKYLGSPPLLYGENENDYKEIAESVRKNLQPANVLEQILG